MPRLAWRQTAFHPGGFLCSGRWRFTPVCLLNQMLANLGNGFMLAVTALLQRHGLCLRRSCQVLNSAASEAGVEFKVLCCSAVRSVTPSLMLCPLL